MYEEYFDKLKKAFQIRNRKESSLEAYKQSISKFLDTIGKNPEEVTLEDARDYIFDLRVNQKKSTQYCNSINSALKFFYRFVLNKPWDEDVVPRMINDLKQPEVMPLESIEKVIDTATAVRNKAIISLLYSSGLRLGELCRLAPSDIYKSTMQVHIRSGKNHWDHWTILSQRSLDLLTEYWKSYPVQREYLFVDLREPHAPLTKSGVETMIKTVGKAAGFPKLHPHVLRHSFASHMIEQGVSLENIQAMMGHRTPESTHKYIHVSNKALMGIKSPLDHPAPKKRGRKKKNG